MNFDFLDMQLESNYELINLVEGAILLRGFCLPVAKELVTAISEINKLAPFRHMTTKGGYPLSAAMTNCGQYGWVSDRKGYRYSELDPISNHPWPDLPTHFKNVATEAASVAGFPLFMPDACLINRYAPGAKMALHQDKDEVDFSAPIVSVSLGLPVIFLFGGLSRTDKAQHITLQHGDVVVWWGPSRLAYHGVLPLKSGEHELLGSYRYNLTFRKAK